MPRIYSTMQYIPIKQVAAVDNEMAHLGEEQEQNLRDLNQKRVQHITTLQQMGKNEIQE